MKERNIVLLTILILLFLGMLNLVFFLFYSEFNFHSSELLIHENNIIEKLFYSPDKPYHLLYRNFQDSMFVNKLGIFSNSVNINSVSCQEGMPYARDNSGTLYTEESLSYTKENIRYTKNNEYGCTYGDALGFNKNKDYWIKSSFSLQPKNLFKIKEDYYIKFIAYSGDKHKLLFKNKNFFPSSNVITKSIFLPADYVIIYIPYRGDISGFVIIEQNNFEFDNSLINLLIIALISPALFFFLWFIFGRESSYADLPSTLSYFPQTNRKGWEVAAFFQPPFSVADKEFFSSMILDLKQKKAIEIKSKNKDTLIKINSAGYSSLDEVEHKFLNLLKKIQIKANPENKEGEFFNLNNTLKQWFVKSEISSVYRALKIDKKIKESGKEYIDDKIKYLMPLLFFVFMFSVFIITASLNANFQLIKFFIFPIVSCLLFISIIYKQSAVLIHFKKDYYKEYQHWQAFRAYLKSFPSMKNSPIEAVKLWDIYLVYAAALGVSKEVLKAFKEWGVINNSQFTAYSGSITISTSLTTSSGSSGSRGGGFGGAGGGGVGGGGGGGR